MQIFMPVLYAYLCILSEIAHWIIHSFLGRYQRMVFIMLHQHHPTNMNHRAFNVHQKIPYWVVFDNIFSVTNFCFSAVNLNKFLVPITNCQIFFVNPQDVHNYPIIHFRKLPIGYNSNPRKFGIQRMLFSVRHHQSVAAASTTFSLRQNASVCVDRASRQPKAM